MTKAYLVRFILMTFSEALLQLIDNTSCADFMQMELHESDA